MFSVTVKRKIILRGKKRKELTELVCVSTCAKPSVMVTQEHMDSGRGERSGL